MFPVFYRISEVLYYSKIIHSDFNTFCFVFWSICNVTASICNLYSSPQESKKFDDDDEDDDDDDVYQKL